MSVNFCYRPLKKDRHIPGGTSTDFHALQEIFGSMPVQLTESDVPKLRAMAVVSRNQFYGYIADAVEQHSGIILDVTE